jgi:peroxiredoxin (alkyl hydroperoxide reductase subunit C)
LLGLSIDSNFSHIAWLRTMQERLEFKGIKHVEIKFPLIADLKMEIARLYGMIHPEADDTSPVRAVFFIDPESRIRSLLYYPQTNGRNFQELKRLLIAMQTSDKFHCATPSNWQPGDDVIMPPPQTLPLADERVEKAGADYACSDWFLCFKRLPEEQLTT